MTQKIFKVNNYQQLTNNYYGNKEFESTARVAHGRKSY